MSDDLFSDRPLVGADEDITRYVGFMQYDDTTGEVGASAFDRTPKDTDGLSVNRVGILATDREEDRANLRKVMSSRFTLGAKAVFAQLNAGKAIAALADFESDIFICHDELPAKGEELENLAHALIIGLPFKGEMIGSLKAEEAGERLCALIHDKFPAKVAAAKDESKSGEEPSDQNPT